MKQFYSYWTLFIMLPCLISCQSGSFQKVISIHDHYLKGSVSVAMDTKTDRYLISVTDSLTSQTDNFYAPYEVYDLQTGDINRDGKTDLCVGIIKTTPFDPHLQKRLFLMQIDRGMIRPLWLCSRLAHPLESFKVIHCGSEDNIISIEKNKDYYCISQYRWGTFGLVFVKQIADSLTLDQANEKLKKL